MHFANYVDEASQHYDVCRAFDEAPHVSIAGTSVVSTFHEESEADLLFLNDLIALHALDVFSEYPRRWKNRRILGV